MSITKLNFVFMTNNKITCYNSLDMLHISRAIVHTLADEGSQILAFSQHRVTEMDGRAPKKQNGIVGKRNAARKKVHDQKNARSKKLANFAPLEASERTDENQKNLP